tara:strand:- start:630 stop:848 length:219 start_codon:yes stop_codon:yes gene_type:complete
MFYDLDKLDNLEERLLKNLMDADGKTHEKEYRPFWINYRQDIPNCLTVIREFKQILERLQNGEIFDNKKEEK